MKTRIQVDPALAKHSLLSAGRKIVAAEGTKGLLTGFGPTAVGYLVQGGAKFAGYEYWKKNFVSLAGDQETAIKYRTPIYLLSSSIAECVLPFSLLMPFIIMTPSAQILRRHPPHPPRSHPHPPRLRAQLRHRPPHRLRPPLARRRPKRALRRLHPHPPQTDPLRHRAVHRERVLPRDRLPDDVRGAAARSGGGVQKFAINLGSGIVAGFAAAILSHVCPRPVLLRVRLEVVDISISPQTRSSPR